MASNTLFPPVVNNTEPAFITYPQGSAWQPGELKIYFKFSALNSDLDHKDEISVHATIHLKESGASVVNIVNGDRTDLHPAEGDSIDCGTFDETRRLRATQIILNLKPIQVPNSDLWYIILKNEDIESEQSRTIGVDEYQGWMPGSIYKVQIRLSEVLCEGLQDETYQQKWLYEHADQFSEWSTVIYSKCLSDFNLHSSCKYKFLEIYPSYTIMPTASEDYAGQTVRYMGTTTGSYKNGYLYICVEVEDNIYEWQEVVSENSYPQTFQGSIEFNMDKNKEYYSSCLLKLYESNEDQEKGTLIEEATIYPNDISMNNFNYTIKYDFRPSNDNEKFYYLIEFSFVTENKYQSDIFTDWFLYPENTINICNYKLETVDVTNHPIIEKIQDGKEYFTSLGKENDNACVGLKLRYDPTATIEFHWNSINLRILRASEETDFTVWEVIKYINLNFEIPPRDAENLQDYLDRLPIFYDYTIESNTFYQYGIQSLAIEHPDDPEQWSMIRKLKETIPNPEYTPGSGLPETIVVDKQIQRDFEYTYIVGKNQRQLKIKFNDNISNYVPQIYDNKLEPIGSQFPYTYRNSKTNYKTFPIAGTISFEMDDNETFLINGDLDIYNGYERVRNLHKKDWVYGKYNYGYERRFRQKVIEFLTDGIFKLFKSSTEGNLIVRLRDVNCTPNPQLSRLIYNFTATVDEVDTNALDNLKKYGIIYSGTYATDWSNIPPLDPDPRGEEVDLPHTHGLASSFVSPTNIPPVSGI